jgi:predicted ATPase
LKAIAPGIESFETISYGDFETVRFAMSPEAGASFDASSMSDGTLRVLAALVAAFQIVLPGGYPGFIGIEEPETSLHPAAMRALVAALDEATLRTQILLTTHSPELLNAAEIEPKNVRVVESQDGMTVITRVDEASAGIVADQLDSLGGLERDRQLRINVDDLGRQSALSGQESMAP